MFKAVHPNNGLEKAVRRVNNMTDVRIPHTFKLISTCSRELAMSIHPIAFAASGMSALSKNPRQQDTHHDDDSALFSARGRRDQDCFAQRIELVANRLHTKNAAGYEAIVFVDGSSEAAYV